MSEPPRAVDDELVCAPARTSTSPVESNRDEEGASPVVIEMPPARRPDDAAAFASAKRDVAVAHGAAELPRRGELECARAAQRGLSPSLR